MTTALPQAAARQALMDLLDDEGSTIAPTIYDRFEAWWYGTAANTRRASAVDIRAWSAFRRDRGQGPVPAGAIDVRDFVRHQARAGLKASSIGRQLASIAVLHDLAGQS